MCEQCKMLASEHVVGGDNDLAIVVPRLAAPGVVVIARQHGPLVELPTKVQEKLLSTASSLSSIIFDNLGAHGTNILVEDGEHAKYTVVARMEEDGIDFRWQPKQASPQEISDAAKRITEETWYIGKTKPKAHAAEHPSSTSHDSQENEPAVSIHRPAYTDPRSGGSPPTDALPKDDTPHIVDSPTEIAEKVTERKKKGPTDEHNYLLRQLTRKR